MASEPYYRAINPNPTTQPSAREERPPLRGDRRRELTGSVSLSVLSLPEGLGPVRILSNLRYNERNEIVVGGARWRRQTLRGGVNEAETTRCGALSAEPAAVPPPFPRDSISIGAPARTSPAVSFNRGLSNILLARSEDWGAAVQGGCQIDS